MNIQMDFLLYQIETCKEGLEINYLLFYILYIEGVRTGFPEKTREGRFGRSRFGCGGFGRSGF